MIAPRREQLPIKPIDFCRIVKTEILSADDASATNTVRSVIDHKKQLVSSLSNPILNTNSSDCINNSSLNPCRADLLSIKVEPNMIASSEANRFFINNSVCFDKLASGRCDKNLSELRNGGESQFLSGNGKSNKFFIEKSRNRTIAKAPKNIFSNGKRKASSDKDSLLSEKKKK